MDDTFIIFYLFPFISDFFFLNPFLIDSSDYILYDPSESLALVTRNGLAFRFLRTVEEKPISCRHISRETGTVATRMPLETL